MPWTLPPQPALATDRFILILTALLRWVWEKPGPAMTGPLSAAIRKRIRSIQDRLALLAKRFHDGTLRPPKPRGPRASRATADAAAPRTPPILPRGFGWLCGLVPSWAAAAGGQMQHQLKEPEMRALEAASPEAARLIRSLLWMTGGRHPDDRYPPPSPRSRRREAEGLSGEPPAPAAPAERRQAIPPPQPPAALLVTPVIDVSQWSHLRLIPGSLRRNR
jgi:hypothetical protein